MIKLYIMKERQKTGEWTDHNNRTDALIEISEVMNKASEEGIKILTISMLLDTEKMSDG
jgi:hypothetical protein